MGRLAGKVTIVTGATSGIGARTAQIFAAEGAAVVLAGRRQAEGERLAMELGPAAVFVRTDVAREEDVAALIAEAERRFGRVDCLFNNAGAPVGGRSIETITAPDFEQAMTLLLGSVVFGMKHVAPIMTRQGSGSIINNGSVAGLRAGYSSSLLYGAAKAGVIQLTRCVAMELGERGIRVNSISPGAIATGIFGKVLGLAGAEADRTAETMKRVFEGRQPLKGPGLPDDIAYAALFLASDESRFVNGHDLVVDGGLIGGRLWREQQEGLQQVGALLKSTAGRPAS